MRVRPFPVVLAVCAATEVEGHLVIEQRGSRVAQGAGMLHVKPSGHVHPPQTPWQALLAETEEELGLLEGEIRDGEWIGLVRSLTAPCVVVTYRMRTTVNWSEMLSRHPVDAWEHDRLIALPLDRQSLESWLLENRERATGPGHAAVLLEGGVRYGEEWFEGMQCQF